jgi:hypothetical protein
VTIGKNGIEIVYSAFIGKELDEIIPRPLLGRNQSKGWIAPYVHKVFQTVTALSNRAHGIRVVQQSTPSLLLAGSGVVELKSESSDSHAVHVSRINLGQERDIAEHKTKHSMFLESTRTGVSALATAERGQISPPVILFGVSRGSATTFNVYATHQYSNVKLVLLECCFFSVEKLLTIRSVPV